jgi:hypothetical protein
MKQFLTDMLERSSGSITVKSQAMAPLAWLCWIAVPVGAAGLALGPASFAWAYVALIGFCGDPVRGVLCLLGGKGS